MRGIGLSPGSGCWRITTDFPSETQMRVVFSLFPEDLGLKLKPSVLQGKSFAHWPSPKILFPFCKDLWGFLVFWGFLLTQVFCLHVCSYWSQRSDTSFLELELRMVVSHNVGLGNYAQILYKSNRHSKPLHHFSSSVAKPFLNTFFCIVCPVISGKAQEQLQLYAAHGTPTGTRSSTGSWWPWLLCN